MAGDETVLEAGCGTGRDTAALLDALPHGRFLATVVLGAQLDRIPAVEHGEFVAAVASRPAEPVVDHVRLEFSARRAG